MPIERPPPIIPDDHADRSSSRKITNIQQQSDINEARNELPRHREGERERERERKFRLIETRGRGITRRSKWVIGRSVKSEYLSLSLSLFVSGKTESRDLPTPLVLHTRLCLSHSQRRA